MAIEERKLGDWLSSWPHKDTHAVCGPGLTTRLELSSWPVMYPHRREMLHMAAFCYAFVSFPLIKTIASITLLLYDLCALFSVRRTEARMAASGVPCAVA